MRRFLSLVTVAVVLAAPTLAHADSLNGQTGTLNYLFPNQSTVYQTFTVTAPGTVVALAGAPASPSNTISGNAINIAFLSGGNFTSDPFNGEQFVFNGFNISSVTVASSTIAAPVLTFDAHDIFINLAGLSVNAGGTLNLAVQGTAMSTVTPEPSSLVLLGTGVLGAVGAMRRRLSW